MTVSHTTVKASELRNGDVLRIGSSENYVLVADTAITSGAVHVTIYNGREPMAAPTLSYHSEAEVLVSLRGQRP